MRKQFFWTKFTYLYLFGFACLLSSKGISQDSEFHFEFIPNQGQWDNRALYQIPIGNGAMFLEKDRLTFSLADYSELNAFHASTGKGEMPEELLIRKHAYYVKFIGSPSYTEIVPFEQTSHHYNYFLGNDMDRWAGKVPSFEKARYINAFEMVDMLLYSHQGNLKYDFILQPGAEIGTIQLEYEGVSDIKKSGNRLVVQTIVGEVVEQEPIAYQIIQGEKKYIRCKYTLENNRVGFQLKDDYQKNRPLYIDPTWIFGSYSGSTADNFGMTATYDEAGNFYAGGMAYDNGYPVGPGAVIQDFFANTTTASGITDVVITKYFADGTDFHYSTYLGGNGTETAHSLIVDEQDRLYLYGVTSSTDFPMDTNAYDPTFNGGSSLNITYNGTNFIGGTDIYAAKFSADGSTLLGSTYIGGSHNDGINYNSSDVLDYDSLQHNYGDQFRGEIMLNDDNEVYIASSTKSNDFPIVSGFDATFGGLQDAVVIKFDTDLENLVWSTYYGNAEKDAAYSVKLDSIDRVFVCGGTASDDIVMSTGAYQELYAGGKTDAYVIKISDDGTTLLKSTYVGTSSYDQTYFLEIDAYMDVYLLGQSEGSIPISTIYSNPGSGQFIMKLDSDLTTLDYSTQIGNGSGLSELSPSAFLVDRCQNVYVSGWGGNILATSPLTGMPTTSDALFSSSGDGFNYWVGVFSQDINSILYGTYYGGNLSQEHVDGGTSRFDRRGVIYQSVCAGCGGNDDFPTTPGAHSNTNESTNCNNGTFKISMDIDAEAGIDASSEEGCAPFTVILTDQSNGGDIVTWNFGSGPVMLSDTDTVVFYPLPGTYTVCQTVTDTICGVTDSTCITIVVHDTVTYEIEGDTLYCRGDSLNLTINSLGTANTFLWSSDATYSDTLNGYPLDSTLNTYVSTTTTFCFKLSRDELCYAQGCVNILVDSITAETNNDLVACGSCTGITTANVTGGSPPYIYEWSDGQTTQQADSLCAGVYVVTVSDSAGCADTAIAVVNDTTNINIDIVDSNLISCHSQCDGMVEIATSGAFPPFSIDWSSGDTTLAIEDLCHGLYAVTVTDTAGCSVADFWLAIQPDSLQMVNVSSTEPDCHGDCTGNIAIDPIGGTPGYSINWTGGLTGDSIFNLCQGEYIAQITDANGCTVSDTINLTEPDSLALDLLISNLVCNDNCNGALQANISGGTPGYNIIWSSGDTSNYIDELCPGEYFVSVEDLKGCSALDSALLITNGFSPFALNVDANPDTIFSGESTILSANPESSGVFSWSPTTGLQNPNALVTSATPSASTTYTFTASDSSGECTFDTSITVVVLDYICGDPNIFIPNAFSPNGDNQNDILYLRGANLEAINLSIYNRWGELVFETLNTDRGWDGSYKGRPVDPNVFVYHLHATCPSGERFFRKGNVTVIR